MKLASVEHSLFWFVHVHRRISRENKHLELFSGFYLKRVIFIDLLNHSTFTIQNGHRRISRKNKHLDLLSGFSSKRVIFILLTLKVWHILFYQKVFPLTSMVYQGNQKLTVFCYKHVNTSPTMWFDHFDMYRYVNTCIMPLFILHIK